MKSLKHNLPLTLFVLLELAVGLLLLVNPEAFTVTIITLGGIVLQVIGALFLYRYFTEKKQYNINDKGVLYLGIVFVLVGLLAAVFSHWILGLFTVVAWVYGLFLVLSGAYKVKAYLDAKKEKQTYASIALVSAVLSIILGIIILLNPFTSTKFLWVFTGLSLVVEALIDLYTLWLSRKQK